MGNQKEEDKEETLQLPVKSLDKDKRVKIIDNWFKIADSQQSTWEQAAREDLNFVTGKQWDADDLTLLASQKRPALTFNHLLSLVNLVSGYERQNRTDIRSMPRKGGTEPVARILNNIIKDILYGCEGEFEQSMAYVYGLITGKGYLGLDISMDDDIINGQIELKNILPFEIRVDPYHSDYDMNDADYLFQFKWMSKNKILRTYASKAKELEELQVDDDDKMPIFGVETDSYKQNPVPGDFHIDKHMYRVKRCYWREYESRTLLINPQDGRIFNPELPVSAIKKILQRRPNLQQIDRVIPKLNLITKVGNVILDDINDPFNGVWRYPIVPFFAYWYGSDVFGIIRNLKDPQREINKRNSQVLHHLNQSANSRDIYEEGSIVNEQDFHDVGTKPGFKIVMRKGVPRDKWPEKREPTSVSQGHLVLGDMSENQIKKISGLNTDLQGQKPERQESGVAMESRRRQGLVITESLFDNYRRTKRILGKRMIDFIQKSGAYSQDEVLNLVVDGKSAQVGINQKQSNEFGRLTGKVLNDVTVGRYDVVIDETPNTPTARLANFASMLEALKIGMPIPPELIVKASDWPNKEEMEQAVSMMDKAKAAVEQNKDLQKENAKLQKALNAVQLDILKKIEKGRSHLVDQIAKFPSEEEKK